eukprot:gnl/TRDRNA2_/TRDRNA2_187775_c0_seq1.p1 gnl/TRDRNA2_/TRDRNA2_187775_c0~~gnl/TRDRNA2_/TRDRNA2_187775_c0_seq1.p1  ORF type:complete len:162 (+),score=48.95 gnl/TRDRNA2_/TRDRNA2_187775_c0_seq1:53-487(+)
MAAGQSVSEQFRGGGIGGTGTEDLDEEVAKQLKPDEEKEDLDEFLQEQKRKKDKKNAELDAFRQESENASKPAPRPKVITKAVEKRKLPSFLKVKSSSDAPAGAAAPPESDEKRPRVDEKPPPASGLGGLGDYASDSSEDAEAA